MADRNVTIGARLELDAGPARSSFDQLVKDFSKPIPVSISGSVASANAATLSGTNLGPMPAGMAGMSSQNLTLPFTRLENTMSQVANALGQLAARLGNGSGGHQPLPMGVGPTAGSFGAAVNPAVAANLARTRGTYSDPAAYFKSAIGEGAAAESAAYPAAAAQEQAESEVAAASGRAGAGRGGSSPFRRLISHFAGGYAIYSAANATMNYGRDLQMEGVAASSGNPNKVLQAQQQTYNNAVSNFGILGGIADFFTGGSVSFAQANQDQELAQNKIESQNRVIVGQRDAGRTLGGVQRQIGIVGARNDFDRQRLEADSQLQDSFDRRNAEVTRRTAEIRNLRGTDLIQSYNKERELSEFRKQQNPILDAAQDLRDATVRRIEENRGFDQTGRNIGFNTSISSNLYAAGNNPLGASLAGILGATQGGINTATANKNPQDISKVLAQGFSEAIREISTTNRGLTLAANAIEGDTAVTRLQIGRQPVAAQRLAIANRRDAALAALPDNSLFNFLGGGRLRAGIASQAEADTDRLNQNDADLTHRIDASQTTRRRQTEALLNRDPIGASAFGISGAARAESFELQRQGRSGEARTALDLGISNLNLTKQDYRDSFRGVAVDLRTMDVSNPRDSESPTKVLGEINKEIQGLRDDIKAITDNDD